MNLLERFKLVGKIVCTELNKTRNDSDDLYKVATVTEYFWFSSDTFKIYCIRDSMNYGYSWYDESGVELPGKFGYAVSSHECMEEEKQDRVEKKMKIEQLKKEFE